MRIFRKILEEMRLADELRREEKEELYRNLIAHFGILGSTDECEKLESAWKTPEYQKAIKKYIEDWISALKRFRKRKEVEIIEVA